MRTRDAGSSSVRSGSGASTYRPSGGGARAGGGGRRRRPPCQHRLIRRHQHIAAAVGHVELAGLDVRGVELRPGHRCDGVNFPVEELALFGRLAGACADACGDRRKAEHRDDRWPENLVVPGEHRFRRAAIDEFALGDVLDQKPGALPYAQFKSAIDEALAKAGSK